MSKTERLSDTLTQDHIYVASRPTGRSSHKIHLYEDCRYLSGGNTDGIRKPASVYPVGWHGLCGVCEERDTDA